MEITESPGATNCVEDGADFSFRAAWRESWGGLGVADCRCRTGRLFGIADWRLQIAESALECIECRDRALFPSWREIMQNSIQIWASKLDATRWPVKPIGDDGELWAWIGKYDDFVGYMAWVLDSGQTGLEPL